MVVDGGGLGTALGWVDAVPWRDRVDGGGVMASGGFRLRHRLLPDMVRVVSGGGALQEWRGEVVAVSGGREVVQLGWRLFCHGSWTRW